MTGRIEVIARVSGRRSWTVEQKLTMLRDAFGPGGSVREAMDRHEVTSGQLYTWRRNAMAGLLVDRPAKVLAAPADVAAPTFAEVIVAPAMPPSMPPSSPLHAAEPEGRITIELPNGMHLTIGSGFDAETLARVLAVVSR